jgi:imidazolonepropionase-like amidohydrolase
VRIASRCLLAAAVVAIFIAAPRADAPHVYAIRGARLVTVASPPIESGTIVIRHGLIESVGTSAAIPPGADVIDGKGLTVYPGLIDLGNTRAADQPMPPQPKNIRTTAELERWKRSQILQPQARASNALKIDSVDLTQLASAGITSVLALPAGEVISGQSAFVNVLAPPDEPQIGNIVEVRRGLAVVKTPIALHVSFPDHPRAGESAYPESLMGVIAFVRQAFLDGQHYALEQAHYHRVKAGDRPTDDPALEALQPALDHKLPVAFEANEAREILRVLNMAREFKLDPIVTGAREAEEVAGDLKTQGARVIYSLNFPQRAKNLAPDADEPARVLRERADAAKTPAELARAGVPFGFESAGLADPKEFVKNVAKVVNAGLPADAAIRALTLGAATIAGVGDRLGSLEAGKVANLLVTDGSLFADTTKIVHVFVDGQPVALKAVGTPPVRSRAPADVLAAIHNNHTTRR